MRGWEGVHFEIEYSLTFPISLSQRLRDLTDVRHLFHRRGDKCRQTFPARLSNDPQAPAKSAGCAHRGIVRERTADLPERMVQREIACDNSRRRAGEEETIALLLHVNAVRADRSCITIVPNERPDPNPASVRDRNPAPQSLAVNQVARRSMRQGAAVSKPPKKPRKGWVLRTGRLGRGLETVAPW